jgi:ketosteroid isomerase-like protein
MSNEESVKQANENFYKAFNRRDIDLMKATWLNDSASVCIHPGWGPLKGYEPIIKSWSDIFENSQNMEIRLSQVGVIFSDSLAWVSCQENLTIITSDGVQSSHVHATNLFQLGDGQWRIILHHASSTPTRSMSDDALSN